MNANNPLIVQSDRSVMLEVDNPLYDEVRDQLALFAELEKSPEHIHTYRISPISVWNAAATGFSANDIVETLVKYSKFPVSENLQHEIYDLAERYGKIILKSTDDQDFLILEIEDPRLGQQVGLHPKIIPFISNSPEPGIFYIEKRYRGEIKRVLIQIGFPVKDIAGFIAGKAKDIELLTSGDKNFGLRKYQTQAVDNFYQGGGVEGGCGVIVLPCGAGKTIVGMGVMSKVKTETLILSANITALRQWRQELLDKTNLTEDDIGEYSGDQKKIAPITLATYQIFTYRPDKTKLFFPHFEVFTKRDWGLIIYDEVHLLPAPIFRITSDLQARRRLGLTATLIREDGKETDVFSLVGPKRYDMPWKELEAQNWLASASCTEIRVPMTENEHLDYAIANDRLKFRISSENSRKFDVIEDLIKRHKGDRILVIGQYITQLKLVAKKLKAPLITGQTPQKERDKLYAQFRTGKIDLMIISKVGNFAVDLPDANIAIQISGTFGSRQEEAQRLGRILRPKGGDNKAHFYTIVTYNSIEQNFAIKRQMFLTEQGYSYDIENVL